MGIVGDFNTTFTSMDRSSRQKISKATEILNDTIEKLDFIDIFRTLHPKKSEYTFFFQVHMEHFQGLTTYWGTKLISTNLRVQKLFQASSLNTWHETRNQSQGKEMRKKKLTTWRLNNMLLKNQWVNKEIKREIKKIL